MDDRDGQSHDQNVGENVEGRVRVEEVCDADTVAWLLLVPAFVDWGTAENSDK